MKKQKVKIKIEKVAVDERVVRKFDVDLMASEMNSQQAKFIVSCYEQQQQSRIRPQSQIRSIEIANGEVVAALAACGDDYEKALVQLCEAHALNVDAMRILATTAEDKSACPLSRESIMRAFTAEHKMLTWIYSQQQAIETEMKKAMGVYAEQHPVGRWAMHHNLGFGPIFATKLLAWLDITKAPTVGHFYSFSGMNPSRDFLGAERARKAVQDGTGTIEDIMLKICAEFGQNTETIRRLATTDRDGNPIELTKESLEKALARRPYHAGAKTLCHLIAETFMKQGPDAYWRKRFVQIKDEARQRNETGGFSKLAADKLRQNPKHKQANIYASGKIPDGHLNNWVLRKLVKQFLIAWHRACYHCHYGVEVPKPYPIAIQGHGHLMPIEGQPAWQEPGTKIDVMAWYGCQPTVAPSATVDSMLKTMTAMTAAAPKNVDVHGEMRAKRLSSRSSRKNLIRQGQVDKIKEIGQ